MRNAYEFSLEFSIEYIFVNPVLKQMIVYGIVNWVGLVFLFVCYGLRKEGHFMFPSTFACTTLFNLYSVTLINSLSSYFFRFLFSGLDLPLQIFSCLPTSNSLSPSFIPSEQGWPSPHKRYLSAGCNCERGAQRGAILRRRSDF